MAIRLKENLLLDILNPRSELNKYTKGILNLTTLYKIELSEKFKFSEEITNLYLELLNKSDSFINSIPLSIVEKYFYQKVNNMNSYISIQFQGLELSIPTNELYILLENYYNNLFLCGSLIANYYNIEIKINNTKEEMDYI